jgi:hypothetical protein
MTTLLLHIENVISHGPHRKHQVQQFYRCACIRCRGNVFTEPSLLAPLFRLSGVGRGYSRLKVERNMRFESRNVMIALGTRSRTSAARATWIYLLKDDNGWLTHLHNLIIILNDRKLLRSATKRHELCTKFWLETLKENDHLRSPIKDGAILKWILQKLGTKQVWNGFSSFSGELLWPQ